MMFALANQISKNKSKRIALIIIALLVCFVNIILCENQIFSKIIYQSTSNSKKHLVRIL